MENTYNASLIYTPRRTEIRLYATTKRQGFHSLSYGRRNNTQSSRSSSNQRAKKNILNLVNQNFEETGTTFVTLTFKENLTDLNVANRTFYSLIRKIRYNTGSLKYISIIEFQKRGAIHYHMLMSTQTQLDFNTYLKKWRDSIAHNHDITIKGGSIRLEPVTDLARTVTYITKYITKNINDNRLCGKKAYLTSHNLKIPDNQRFMLKSDDRIAELIEQFPQLSHFSQIEKSYYKDRLTNKLIQYIVLT